MSEPPESPPLPLQMSRDDVSRVADFLAREDRSRSALESKRLLIEILDCLRRIDDKLERLLETRQR